MFITEKCCEEQVYQINAAKYTKSYHDPQFQGLVVKKTYKTIPAVNFF